MKTTVLLTLEHSKPLPDITDVICQRVWPYGGGCITDRTAAIVEPMKFEDDTSASMIGRHDGSPAEVRMPTGFAWPTDIAALSRSDTIRYGNETFSKERMREAIKAGRAQS